MTSRVLGLVREQVLASLFGAGNAMDAFIVAFRVPNLLRDLFAEGAMSAAFVPTFTRTAHASTARPPPGGSATTSSTRCSSSPASLVVARDRLRATRSCGASRPTTRASPASSS